MASFVIELWESIFTPGPTPTILKATNATFAALQAVLLALLLATYSVHFVVLSALCGGLWYSINWFAAELAVQQKKEEDDKRREREKLEARAVLPVGDAGGDSSDTEVEDRKRVRGKGRRSAAAAAAAAAATTGSTAVSSLPPPSAAEVEAETESADVAVIASDVEVVEAAGDLTNRAEGLPVGAGLHEPVSAASTEDEWEKVSENENEKDK